jgi:hypothetical protein
VQTGVTSSVYERAWCNHRFLGCMSLRNFDDVINRVGVESAADLTHLRQQ